MNSLMPFALLPHSGNVAANSAIGHPEYLYVFQQSEVA
jgi:hypothetical protein